MSIVSIPNGLFKSFRHEQAQPVGRLSGFNPKRAFQVIPTRTPLIKRLHPLVRFQSQTGFQVIPTSYRSKVIIDILAVSIPNGLLKSFRLVELDDVINSHASFNPKRAFKSFRRESLGHNGYAYDFNPKRASKVIPTRIYVRLLFGS